MSNPTTKRVAELEDELHALAEHSITEARRLREAEATIDRVRRTVDAAETEVQETGYRPRFDEGATGVIRAVQKALGEEP